ncbi:male determiner protein Mdmd(III)-like [Paralichthys olivaceus]|uniref:male determiner protein Mdmd(III)-like n=1 Tax=Paralichthys olivaceus TaxID=8255 RepID=UPI0037529545
MLEEYRRKERERYQKRKQNGQITKTKDLTKKQHEKKKKQWRKNSKRYYTKKRQLKAILDTTPVSDEDEEANEIIQNVSEDQLQHVEFQTSSPTTYTPKELKKETKEKEEKTKKRRKKTMQKLKSKLCSTEEKLVERKRKERLKRLEMSAKRKQVTINIGGREAQNKKTKWGHKRTYNILSNSQRRLMSTLISRFLHQDDVSTVINGKSGEIRKKGQIFRKRALTDTMANLHKRFLSENPRHSISKAQFFKLKPFWIGQRRVSDRETCACKTHENFGLKTKKLHQLGVIDTSSPRDLVLASVCSVDNLSCMYRTCNKCKDKTFPTTLDPSTKGNIIAWDEWVTKSVPLIKRCKDGSTEEKEVRNVLLDKRHTSIEKLVELTQDHLPNFSRHIFNIKHQFERLRSLRETLTQNDVVVHIDYSENYACKYTREIKETHFLIL